MDTETQLLSFKTSDRETLHGLLFTPREQKSDLALLLVHGVAMNFICRRWRRSDRRWLNAGITVSSSTRAVMIGFRAQAI